MSRSKALLAVCFSILAGCGKSASEGPDASGATDGGAGGATGGAGGVGRATGGAGGAGGATGGADGTGAVDGGPACAFSVGGPSFTFHIRNAGTTTVWLDLGCGMNPPIVLDTADGMRGIGPGSADRCEFSCDQVFAGNEVPGQCTDCGGGYQTALAAGQTTDIVWDRRVYVAFTIAPPCSSRTGNCALGSLVASSTAQMGTLTGCLSNGFPGTCASPLSTAFTVDTTGNQATVSVTP